MVVKKYIFLLLAATWWLEAMDGAEPWKERRASLLASIQASRKNLDESMQKSKVLVAPSELRLAICNHDKDSVLTIITDVPTVLWQDPTYHSSWIEHALYYANRAEREGDQTTASILDDIAILIFNQMKQLAANTGSYPQSLAQILQNRNPILVCCTYNRPRVMNAFLQDIDTRWRGSQDEKAPIDWAIDTINASTRWITAQTIHNLPPSNNPYFQSVCQAQQIIATFQQKNPTITLQFAQPPQPPYQQQLAQQQALFNAQKLQHQQHIPGPELAPQPTALWKKIVVFAVAAYACKKLYDWYYQAPKSDTDDEPDDAFYHEKHTDN